MEKELQKIKIGKTLGVSGFETDKAVDFTGEKGLKNAKSLYLSGFNLPLMRDVAKILAATLGFSVFDINLELEKQLSMPVKEMNEKLGEVYFRAVEHSFIDKLSRERNVIAVCGLGAMLTEKNFNTAKKNGEIVFVDAECDDVPKYIQKLQRALYEKHSTLKTSSSAASEAAKEILKNM